MRAPIPHLIEKINVAKHLTSHVIGENHTRTHRRIAGLFIAIAGVGIAQATKEVQYLHIVGELVGYGIHGIGMIPWLKDMEQPKVIHPPLKQPSNATQRIIPKNIKKRLRHRRKATGTPEQINLSERINSCPLGVAFC